MNCPCTGSYRKLSVNNPRPYYRCMGAEDGCDVQFGCVIYWNDDHWRFASGTTSCNTYSNNQNTPNVPTSGWNDAVKSISMYAPSPTTTVELTTTPEPTMEHTEKDHIPTDSTQIHIVVDENEMNCPCTGSYRKLSVNNPRPYYR